MSELDILQELEPQPNPAPVRRRGLSPLSLILLAGLLVVVVVVGIALAQQNRGTPTAGPAPDFTVTTFDGQTMSLADLRGQVVVVNFWASWCGPCRDEAPLYESLWQRYRDQNVTFLGITYVDDPANSQAFIDQYGITYPNAPDVGTVISKERYLITGVPETFVIDQDGNIVSHFWYLQNEAQLATPLDQLLAS